MNQLESTLNFVKNNFHSTGIPAPAFPGRKVGLRSVYDKETGTYRLMQTKSSHCDCDCACESPGDF